MILYNETSQKIISENLELADNYFKRLKGLMFTKELPEDNALQIIPCNEIHTFFMKYDLDVIYIDKNNKILALDENLKPCKVGKKIKGAWSVIELPAGKIKRSAIEIGQTISFRNNL